MASILITVEEDLFSNSSIFHQVRTKEIGTMTAVWIYVISISIDFYDFISPFSLWF